MQFLENELHSINDAYVGVVWVTQLVVSTDISWSLVSWLSAWLVR